MVDTVILPGPAIIKVTPTAFLREAQDYLRCGRCFRTPRRFSSVPYFLYCRAIELGLKAIHAETLDRQNMKRKLGHDLVKSYNALPSERRLLSRAELGVLRTASRLYADKDFEYVTAGHILTAYSGYPALADLEALASRILRLSDAPDEL